MPFVQAERTVSSPAFDAFPAAFADKKKALNTIYALIEELEVVRHIVATPSMARLLKKIVLPKLRAALADCNALIGEKMRANRILASFFGAQSNYDCNPNTVTVGLTG